MKSAIAVLAATLAVAGCNRPLRTAGLVTAGALVAGGVYVSADTPDCQPGDILEYHRGALAILLHEQPGEEFHGTGEVVRACAQARRPSARYWPGSGSRTPR